MNIYRKTVGGRPTGRALEKQNARRGQAVTGRNESLNIDAV